MKMRTVLEFSLAALIVVSLGALSGWYFFLRGEIRSTVAQDSARGFGAEAPTFGGALGSAYQNALSAVFGAPESGSADANNPARLWQVDRAPVAGAGFVQTEKGARLYFAERGSGYIFSADLGAQTVARLSNTLMPKTYEAFFGKSGAVVERSLDEGGAVTTFAGSLATSSSADDLHALSGGLLAKGIERIAVSPASDEIFYLVRESGAVVGIRARHDGSGQKRIFASGIGGWQVEWLPDGRIVLLQDPADGVPGYAYELKNAGVSALIGGLPGLTVLPRASSTALLYSTSGGGGIALFSRVSASSSAMQLPIKTVAEKCVWSPAGQSPPGGAGGSLVAYCAVPQTSPVGGFLNAWYKGQTHPADAWWRVDASAGTASILFAPPSNLALDVKNPVMDERGGYIAFVNNADLSLWLLRVGN